MIDSIPPAMSFASLPDDTEARALIGANGALIVPGSGKVDIMQAQDSEPIVEHQACCLRPIALIPAILFANQNTIGCDTISIIDVTELGQANRPQGRLLINNEL